MKFESTKSLASTSSRSLGGALSENGDREAALQNVLTFIAEQQKYVQIDSRPCSLHDITKEFNIEAPPQHIEDLRNCECDNSELCLKTSVDIKSKPGDNENYVTLKQLCTEYNSMHEQKRDETCREDHIKDDKAKEEKCRDGKSREANEDEKARTMPGIAYAEEVCLVTPIDVESENCSNISEHPVDICSSVNVELSSTDYQQVVLGDGEQAKSGDQSDLSDNNLSQSNTMSESLTSTLSTSDTVVSKIPRRVNYASKIPVSPAKIGSKGVAKPTKRNQSPETSKIPKSKMSYKNSKIAKPKNNAKQQRMSLKCGEKPQQVAVDRLPPQYAVFSNIIDGPPHRAVSFHERATSKDVIDELNRMIKNGDEVATTAATAQDCHDGNVSRLDAACKSTGWIHVEKDIDLNDPKVITFNFNRSTVTMYLR